MKRSHKIEISIAIGLIIAIIVSLTGFSADCENVRSNVVRLHILADSDCDADQKVKLLVRDALLESGAEIFSGTISIDTASDALEKEKDKLIAVAETVLRENGFDYDVTINMVREYYTTRTYENYTLPAGEYLSLKVILGKGEGRNWWCVMFPPLCLPAASPSTDIDAILGADGAKLIKSNPKYEMRFKIVEIFESVRNRF